MASPPYTIATTSPADTDIISIFPGQERPYRDVVWSWLNQIASASTGLLLPSAFPSFVNSWVIQSVDVNTDAVLTYQNSLGVNRSKSLWNHTSDKHSFLTYAVDGVTIKTQLDLIGGAGTANVNVAAGSLTVGGVAVMLPSYAGTLAGLTGVGALASGSIGGSFGAINIGANTLTAGASTLGALGATTGTFSGAVSGTTITGTGNVQGTNIVSTSNVFANSTATTMNLRPSGAASTTGQMTIATNGNVTASGDLTANSDRRLKTSISPLNHQWANDMVREVQPMTFIWKRKGHERGIGFIAQDVEGYAPELVHADQNGIRALAYPNMVAILWAVVQDLQAKVEELSK